jgi:hypothetical protein
MIAKAFLLDRAHVVSAIANEYWNYDIETDLNMVRSKGSDVPVCTTALAITGSKTEAAPGDDDPDPDVELMY